MIFNLILKFIATPVNIIGFIWSIASTICICLIFSAWKEKWWKSLIPFYGQYIIYKHTWKSLKWLFVAELVLNTAGSKCRTVIKADIGGGIFDIIRNCIKNGQIDTNIDFGKILVLFLVSAICMLIVFLLQRVTYARICISLGFSNTLLIIGTFLLPQIFLWVVYYKYVKMKGQYR